MSHQNLNPRFSRAAVGCIKKAELEIARICAKMCEAEESNASLSLVQDTFSKVIASLEYAQQVARQQVIPM